MSKKVFAPIIHNGLGMVMSEFMVSFLHAMEGRRYEVDHIGDSLASRAMNRISATFLESDCDEIFVWDTDINATREQISMLFSHDLPIVFGLYPIKEPGLKLCASHETGEFPVTDEPLIEMRRSGRGFVRIHREVFERMKMENGGKAAPYYNHGRVEWDFWSPGVYQPPLAVLPDEYLCENWAFCEHARELGYKIMVDQRISLQHRGLINYPIRGTYEERPREAWEYIEGWFNYCEVYKRIASTLKDGSRFCEAGVYLGKSLGAMASYCRGKKVTFYAVDTFKGDATATDDNNAYAPAIGRNGGSFRAEFEENMMKCGLNGNLQIIDVGKIGNAGVVSDFIGPGLDACFIDGDHSFKGVQNDIDEYWELIREGGILAGHDYDRESVRDAVQSRFRADQIEEIGNCWLVKK